MSMSTSQAFRIQSGGCIDRQTPLSFTFDGKKLGGFMGDTLASALLANGIRLVGRSFKFHRPRGILGAGAEECNALLTIGKGGLEEPNVRATLQPLYDGLEARSQNCWPSVNYDLGRSLDYLAFLWPAGFYNKTFIWPNWHWYEGFIRRAAGLGNLPPADDLDDYSQRNVHCEVLIVGSGPAGLAAALAASETGDRVIVLEQDTVLGGSLLWTDSCIDGEPGAVWLSDTIHTLADRDNVTLLTRTTASAWFDHHLIIASQQIADRRAGQHTGPRERLWKIHTKETVLATGAIEQPLVFANNDRPGIMLASAVQAYCKRFAVRAGNRIVIATNNDSAYELLPILQNSGAEVTAIIDSRQKPEGIRIEVVRDQGIDIFPNAIPLDCFGDKAIRRVVVAKRNGLKTVATLECDCIAMAGGWQPAVHLFTQARGKLRYETLLGAFVPDVIPPHIHLAGMLTGELTLDLCLEQGWQAGLNASGGRVNGKRPYSKPEGKRGLNIERAWSKQRSHHQWLDYQHDVTLQDVDIAVSENYTSVEHLKRYTTIGMSVDQGKTSNLNALTALAERTGCEPGEVGTTTFRPFYLPVTMGALAGRNAAEFYAPVQQSPMFECHKSLNAKFDDYGLWRRPRVYLRDSEDETAAIAREAIAAREAVVLFDGSPLGKIEVHGRDAAEFLNRIYINNVKSLATGRARYGLMLNENGIVIDDGIFARLAEDRFLVHTTSGGAAGIYAWMERWLQVEWPDLQVLLTPVTNQWANIAVSGPQARELLTRLEIDIDITNESLPHMGIRSGNLDGNVVRILRASFTGELCYEINIPANLGAALWQQLLRLGEDLQVMPIGFETLMVLRTEKGYLHVGSDTDANTTPRDIGWAKVTEKKQDEFIGKRSLSRRFNVRAERLEFVGITPADENSILHPGAHVIDTEHVSAPARTQGYVTSGCYSPNLQRYVGLGLVQNGSRRLGERVNVYDNGVICSAVISAPDALDPAGERLHA